MRIIIITAVLIAVIAIAAAVICIAKPKTKHNILDGPGMERQPHDYINACSYSSSGGMDGGYEHIELKEQPDGTVLFTYSCCPYNGAEEEAVEKNFPDRSVFEPIAAVCEHTGVLTWGELADSELILLDVPVTGISFTFFDSEQYSVNDTKSLPEKGNSLFPDIYNYLISLK